MEKLKKNSSDINVPDSYVSGASWETNSSSNHPTWYLFWCTFLSILVLKWMICDRLLIYAYHCNYCEWMFGRLKVSDVMIEVGIMWKFPFSCRWKLLNFKLDKKFSFLSFFFFLENHCARLFFSCSQWPGICSIDSLPFAYLIFNDHWLQVHRAILHNGEKVVVKVQRPGLKKLFDIDLRKWFFSRGVIQFWCM